MSRHDDEPLFAGDSTLQSLEDPQVTAAFEQMQAAAGADTTKRRLKVSHLIVMAVVLAALPAALLWALGL